MIQSHCLGFPRIGAQRENKKAVEQYWQQKIDQDALLQVGAQIRKDNWKVQADAGLSFVTVGDFAWYDHVLETSAMFGVIPERFGECQGDVDLDTVFRMARGRAPSGQDAAACEMTKWFDTNYHYIVPEFTNTQTFRLASQHLFTQLAEAQQLGYQAKPVILGPLSYLWLGKCKGDMFDKLTLLDKLLPVYAEILSQLKEKGVTWLQIDEPILALDLPVSWQQAFERAYNQLHFTGIKMMLSTYFNSLEENTSLACELPTAGLHIDCVRGANQLTSVLDKLPKYKVLSVGAIDGRNIWRADLSKTLETLQTVAGRLGERLWVASSCSLLHSPVDLNHEDKLDDELKSWLAFAVQKVSEIASLAKALNDGPDSIQPLLAASDSAVQSRQTSQRIHKSEVKKRLSDLSAEFSRRKSSYARRAKLQKSILHLPEFPTTTIGSFPQTTEIRQLRRDFKQGKIDAQSYVSAIKQEIVETIKRQEAIGLDVLVHGEPERNDMVEYFGEHFDGFAFTANGWVQSYGSRCVKPPIIYGDVSRSEAITVAWTQFAQENTDKLMKGMLTGPVTILCWSFVRDDQARETTAKQIALALRDEVQELEAAGIKVIQVDEPAFREGLPLRRMDWNAYLDWAVECFKLSTCGVKDETQIHTHMCYAEFNDTIEAIAKLDADVITIESSRSQMELLESFSDFEYPNEIGPGIYDIHSPIVPSKTEIMALLHKAMTHIPAERLWVNPDCGLKTRDWPEVEAALINMVNAAKALRAKKSLSDVVAEEAL